MMRAMAEITLAMKKLSRYKEISEQTLRRTKDMLTRENHRSSSAGGDAGQ